MTRAELQVLLPAMDFYSNGGDLWMYSLDLKRWLKQNCFHEDVDMLQNVIGDRHLDARKHFALGGELDYRGVDVNSKWMRCITTPSWDACAYRPKEDEIEWQWAHKMNDGVYGMCKMFYTEEEVRSQDWIKFEPSRRVRNG